MKKDRKLFIAAFLLLALALVSCQSEFNGNLETQTRSFTNRERIKGLKGLQLIDPASGNCIFNQLEAHEEGLRASGATGGLALVGNGIEPVGHPSAISSELGNILNPVPSAKWKSKLNPWYKGKELAVILIVDDFGGTDVESSTYSLGEEIFNATFAKNGEDIDAQVDKWVESKSLLHGPMVYSHTLALISHLPGAELFILQPHQALFTYNDLMILVKAADTQGFTTDLVAGRIIETLTQLNTWTTNNDMAYSLSVNMSYSIVPCSVLYDYRYARDNLNIPTFQEYIEELEEFEENQEYANLDNLLEDLLEPVNEETDPLYFLVHESINSGSIKYVASSGNYGLNYALAPAAWDKVIAVAASDLSAANETSSYSNNGVIKMPATWSMITDPTGHNGVNKDATEGAWAGSSASAPAVTTFVGLDSAKRTPVCGFEPDSLKPKLAGIDKEGELGWEKKIPSLEEAINLRCKSNKIAKP